MPSLSKSISFSDERDSTRRILLVRLLRMILAWALDKLIGSISVPRKAQDGRRMAPRRGYIQEEPMPLFG